MCSTTERKEILCPHCGAEQTNDDDLCKFCGKVMVPVGPAKSASTMVTSGLRSLKAKIRPMTAEELDEYDVAPMNLSLVDPSDPTFDD